MIIDKCEEPGCGFATIDKRFCDYHADRQPRRAHIPGPDDGLPGLEDTAAVRANLVYRPLNLWAPGHALLMQDDAGDDVRYPSAEERERARAKDWYARSLQTSEKLAALDIDALCAWPENITDRRSAYELTSENTKEEIRRAVAAIIVERRNESLTTRVDAIVNAVLDTVGAP